MVYEGRSKKNIGDQFFDEFEQHEGAEISQLNVQLEDACNADSLAGARNRPQTEAGSILPNAEGINRRFVRFSSAPNGHS